MTRSEAAALSPSDALSMLAANSSVILFDDAALLAPTPRRLRLVNSYSEAEAYWNGSRSQHWAQLLRAFVVAPPERRNGWRPTADWNERVRSVRSALRLALWADQESEALSLAWEQREAIALAQVLLRTGEEETGLASITAATIFLDVAAVLRLTESTSEDEVESATTMVVELQRALRVVLATLLNWGDFEFDDHPPPHQSSPCGVIRFAAPLVPRAPGSAAVPPAPSSVLVLAA
ncbi:hypothetical protein JHN59_08005 [Streptomyces sp. MBT49]|uniref:hypothetical protein n=1 Tax=Streptomyces sp. MBT49 TaxID=1488380 RepID=UPI00190A34F0|nr:hypothetical protein [Streptomyces sp. MBT49]MBK3624793.1 hypothetical protein [Streptomyces sp. MBT49]